VHSLAGRACLVQAPLPPAHIDAGSWVGCGFYEAEGKREFYPPASGTPRFCQDGETTVASILYLDKRSPRDASLSRALLSAGFQVRTTARPTEAGRLLRCCLFDCVLARCVEEECEGIVNLCSDARDLVNVVMVLMDVADVSLEARLFDCGVDDVVAGDQTRADLVAKRIKARLRSTGWRGRLGGRVRLGNVTVDFDRQTVERDGITHQLSGILADLLRYFICNADHVISRQELNDSSIWVDSICTPAGEGGKTFDVHVSRLRKVIEHDSRRPALIRSVRGIGWKLTAKPTWANGVLPVTSDRTPDLFGWRSALG